MTSYQEKKNIILPRNDFCFLTTGKPFRYIKFTKMWCLSLCASLLYGYKSYFPKGY